MRCPSLINVYATNSDILPDGGGVRGLAELVMLEKLFEKINFLRKQARLPQKQPWQIFDIMGGTSTGG